MKPEAQEKRLFEYATIRVVPRVEREEFINIGVVVYCASIKFLQCKIYLDEARLAAFPSPPDIDELKKYIHGFELVCKGGKDSGPIGTLSPAERFRWLTATRSTMLQTSRVHPGLCEDPELMVNNLFAQMVS